CDVELPRHQRRATQNANRAQEIVGRGRDFPSDHLLQAVERLTCLEGEEVCAREWITHPDKVSRHPTVHQYSHLPNGFAHSHHDSAADDAVTDFQLSDLWNSSAGGDVEISEAVSGVHGQTHFRGVTRSFWQLGERSGVRPPRVSVTTGVQLDRRDAEVLGG